MPNEDDMSECPTLSPFYRIRRAIQAQASASASGMMVIPKIETAAGCDGLKLMIR